MVEKTYEPEFMPDNTTSLPGARLVPGADPDPTSPNHAIVESAVQARGGVNIGSMRWVLGISLTAVIIAFIVIWLVAKSS